MDTEKFQNYQCFTDRKFCLSLSRTAGPNVIIIKFAQKGLFELKRNAADHQRVLLLATSIMSIGIGEFCGIGNSIQADFGRPNVF